MPAFMVTESMYQMLLLCMYTETEKQHNLEN